MAAERIPYSNPEQKPLFPVPSTLHLFRFDENERVPIQQMAQKANLWEIRVSSVRKYNEQLGIELRVSGERMLATNRDLNEQQADLLSSRSASSAYLKIHNELSGKGADEEQIMDFFKRCLTINTGITTDVKTGRIKTFGARKNVVNQRQVVDRFTALVNELSKEPPSWFGNNLHGWRKFLAERAAFGRFLNPDLVNQFGDRIPPSAWDEGRLSLTYTDALPDWLTERGDELPAKSVVEEELEEDTKEYEAVKISRDQNKKHISYLNESAQEKSRKLMVWCVKLIREIFKSDTVSSLPECLIFINFSREYGDIAVNDLTKISTKEALMKKINPVAALEGRITDFVHEKGLTSIHLMALYLEDRLKTAGIFEDASSFIDSKSARPLTLLFTEATNKSGANDENWAKLRDENDPAFGPLNYDLKPLLTLLAVKDLSYLTGFTQHAQYRVSYETLIWEMANLIIENTTAAKELAQVDKPLDKALVNYITFSKWWLRKHWQWAYEEVLKSVSVEAAPQQMLYTEEEETPEIEEVKTAIENIQKGDLANWNLYYTERMVPEIEAADQIPGITLEEREHTLNGYLLDNNISCSIGADSVIRTLEWLTSVPQEIEQIGKKKIINGVAWNRRRRGAVRIFSRMNRARKEIVFFVYQKKAWKYGF